MDIETKGRDNRVAGRDYYESPIFIRAHPPPDKPGLMKCPTCDRRGLAPSAASCPECGHDFTVARLLARRRRNQLKSAIMMTLSTIAVTLLIVCSRSDELLNGLLVYGILALWCTVGLAWLAYYWRHARASHLAA